MRISKMLFTTLAILAGGLLFGCTGDSNTTAKNSNPSLLSVEAPASGKKRLAKLEGSEITVSNATDDQQNPHEIYIPVKNVYFSVWEDWRNVNLGEIRPGVGVGLFYATPVGPIRIDYGMKLDKKPGETPGVFNFSVGYAF